MNPAAFKSVERSLDERVVYAHRGNFDSEVFDPEFLSQFLLNRLPRLRTEASYPFFGVIPGKRGQIHTRNGTQKPCRLPVLLHCSPRYLRLRSSFDGACINANFPHPIQIERNPGVRQ
jgi:hypothetical protein